MRKIYWLFSVIIIFVGCTGVAPLGLYETPVAELDQGIDGFRQTVIYANEYSADIWFTQSKSCIDVMPENKEAEKGNQSLHIKWNKGAGDCPWLGMGIGWEQWTGKDISGIENKSALSFWIKSKTGPMKSIPWAVGLEDFTGAQAWTGFQVAYIKGNISNDNWTQVVVPLADFPFGPNDLDLTSIKQMIIQFESSGEVLIDEISIIPFTNKTKESLQWQECAAPTLDGVWHSEEWPNSVKLYRAELSIFADDKSLYIGGRIQDPSPCVNNRSGKDIWNGDAIEVAFSTVADLSDKRYIFYETDRHIGIKMGDDNEIFDWSRQKTITGSCKTSLSTEGFYSFECVILWEQLGTSGWKKGNTYDLELAIDVGNDKGERIVQNIWNSAGKEGFYLHPSLWGKLDFNLSSEN